MICRPWEETLKLTNCAIFNGILAIYSGIINETASSVPRTFLTLSFLESWSKYMQPLGHDSTAIMPNENSDVARPEKALRPQWLYAGCGTVSHCLHNTVLLANKDAFRLLLEGLNISIERTLAPRLAAESADTRWSVPQPGSPQPGISCSDRSPDC